MSTESELIAYKLREVVEALVSADAALESRIARLEDLLFEPSATQPEEPAWHGISQDILRDAPPGTMIEFTPPRRKRWFSRAH